MSAARTYTDPEIRLARQGKRAGVGRSEFLKLRRRGTETAAKDGRWSRVELAAARADIEMAADEVYGTEHDYAVKIINEIVSRWLNKKRTRLGGGGMWNREQTTNCILACYKRNHINLDKLSSSEQPHFGHDVTGIQKFTAADGSLRECFWPRCGGEE